MNDNLQAYDLTNAERIGEGLHGAVYVLTNGREVIKVYGDNSESKTNTAKMEFTKLENAARAFRGFDYIQSPTPLELYQQPAAIRMSRCYGTPLLEYLAEQPQGTSEHHELVLLLSDGILAYVRACGESLPDCSITNLLYNAKNGILSFVDFAPHKRLHLVDQNNHAIVFSVESLISSTLREFLHRYGRSVINAWPMISFLMLATCSRVLAEKPDPIQSVALTQYLKFLDKYCTTRRGLQKHIAYRLLSIPLAVILKYLTRRIWKKQSGTDLQTECVEIQIA